MLQDLLLQDHRIKMEEVEKGAEKSADEDDVAAVRHILDMRKRVICFQILHLVCSVPRKQNPPIEIVRALALRLIFSVDLFYFYTRLLRSHLPLYENASA